MEVDSGSLYWAINWSTGNCTFVLLFSLLFICTSNSITCKKRNFHHIQIIILLHEGKCGDMWYTCHQLIIKALGKVIKF